MTATTFNPLIPLIDAGDLEAAGIERRQAEAIASKLIDAATAELGDLATKTDLRDAIGALRSEMRWMFGFIEVVMVRQQDDEGLFDDESARGQLACASPG